MKWMPVLIVTVALCVCDTVLAKDSRQSARMPDALLGIWQPRTAEGADRCRQFKKALMTTAPNSDERYWPLVRSIVITSQMAHAYSDYGEGNFHAVRSVEALGKGQWRIEGPVGMDGVPEATDPAEASRFVLKTGVLHWFVRNADGLEVPSGEGNSGYARCMKVPAEMRYDE